MTGSTGQETPTGAAWGREVTAETVRGHPCRVYATRRRRVAELLIDARRWSHRTHIVQGQRRLTFDEHEAAVARTAAFLSEQGIGTGDQVVLFGRNSLECTLAYWASHALGAVVVLANAWWSEAEVANVFRSFSPALVLHDSESAALLPGGVTAFDFSQVTAVVDQPGGAARVAMPEVGEDDPALVIFTSGSTGAAKGVILSQRSYLANLQNLLLTSKRLPSELGASHQPGVNMLSVPLFHLAGVQVISAGLVSGAKLVYQAGRFDAGEVLRLIEAERVTTWGAVPAMVTRVMEHPDFGRRDTSSLRSIPLGGSSANPGFRERVQQKFPTLKGGGAGSLYGFTEVGGLVAMGTASDIASRPGSVGRLLPIIDVQIGRPDESGDGEILVRSPGAMSGFVDGSPPPVDDNGWVRSGDVGHLDADGYLYLTGRIKDIIIRGGENISCAHVEQALMSHPGVAEVVVVGLPHAELQEQVGAVVTLKEDLPITIDELRSHATARLGRFEVPTRWWLRTSLVPTNAQGKIVRNEIRDQWLEAGGENIAPYAEAGSGAST